MKIYDKDNRLILDINVDDNSYRNRQIMADHNLTLYYSLPEHIEIPVGAYCEFEGQRYTLLRPEQFKMKHTRLFQYTVVFSSDQDKAKIWKFRNPVDGRLKFPLTAKPKEHLQMFVDNMNRRDTGWTVGECIDDVEKLITYDHDYCWDALTKQASEFETEFEIVGKRVSLHKVEYNKSNPLPLSYGRGNGFKPGLGRSNSGDKLPVEILFVQGGDRNIDRSKYGNGELLLPKNQTIGYDGEHFEDEDGYNPANARHYLVDDLGLSIRNIDRPLSSLAEDSLDRTDDYPKRVGTISSVVEVDKEKNFYDFIDNTIPPELNYEDYLIDGETMSVIFQSGMLAGREFDVKYYHEAKKGKAARRFEIVPQEIDGMTMPGGDFVPKAGQDTYAIFHVMLPDAYIRNDADKSGASWDMFRAAVKYLFDNEEKKFTFTGELDGIWAKREWINIGAKIRLGGFIRFTSEQFEKEGVLVRITSVKDYINNPHAPKIELSNEIVSGSVSSTLKKLEATEVVAEEYHRNAIQFTKRRFRDAKETIEMIENALSDNFTNRINPIAVETMSLLVGDERLQYQFVDAPGSTTAVPHNITWNDAAKQLIVPAGTIQHLTLGIDSISPTHQAHEYHYWNVERFESASLEDGTAKYYLYIRAQKEYNGNAGSAVFRLETNAHKLEDGNYYWLLVGILNTEYDGERSFASLYGFTEILPGRITADRLVAADGESYFDMLHAALKLKDKLSYNVNGDGKLILQGTLVQSESGDISPLGVYRGVWDENIVYYQNDEVTYSRDGSTATYRYINAKPGKGHIPTNSHYWAVSAKGKDGESVRIDTQSVTYQASAKGTEPPDGEWSETIPEVPDGQFLWAKTEITYTNGKSTVTYSVSRHGQSVAVRKTETKYIKGKNAASQPADSEFDQSQLIAPGALGQGDWLWSRTTVEYTDGTTTKSYSCSMIGTDGEQGQPGVPGKDGNPAYIHFAYASTIDGTLPHPSTVGGFSPSPYVGAKYIGVYTDSKERDSANHADYDWSVYSSAGYAPNLLNGTANGRDGWNVAAYAPAESDDDIVRVPLSAWNCQQSYMSPGYTGIGVTVGGKNITSCNINFKSKGWNIEQGKTYTLSFSLRAGAGIAQFDIYLGRGPGWGDMVTNFVRLSRPQGASTDRYAIRLTATEKATAAPENLYVIFNFSDSFKDFPANTGIEIAGLKLEADWNDNPVWTPSSDDLTGKPGDYTELRFAVNGSKTVPPSLADTARNPNGWSVEQPQVAALQYLWRTQARISGSTDALLSGWSAPVRITPYDGTDGKDAPMMVFRGVYDPAKTYYGNAKRADVVRYNSRYYVASISAGTLVGVTPAVGSNWNDFGAEFESVATNFMLAEHAAIGNWVISGDNIVSTHGKVAGVESDDFENPSFIPDVILDGATGKLTFGKDMELTRNGLTLLSDGYQKLRVVNCSLGEYNKNMLLSSGTIELEKTQTSSVEIYEMTDMTTGTVTRPDAILDGGLTENLGFMSFGSVINIKSFSIRFTVPVNGAYSGGPTVEIVSSGMPALKVQILRDGQVVKETVSEVKGAYTSGQVYQATGGALSYTVPDGGEGGYSVKVVTNGIFVGSVNTGRIDISHTLKLSGTFNKNNFDQNVLANDGFLSCWGGSTAIYARKGKVINKAGGYELHVDANEGIFKIVNGTKTAL